MGVNLSTGGGAARRLGKGRGRLAVSVTLLFVLSLLLQYASFVGSVSAVHDDGIFELDGNALDQGAVPGDDWENGQSGAADTLFIPGSVEKDGVDVTYFKGGGSKDHHDLDEWDWSGTDVAPDKDELLDVFAAVYEAAETSVYFGADKFDDSGDAQIGFWFFQDSVSLNANGTFDGLHTVGDVLVLSDFTNGGAVDLICVYEWNPPGDDVADDSLENSGCDIGDNVTLVAAGAECDVSSPDGAFDVCAVVNSEVTDAPWPFVNKDGATDFGVGQFFEGGINLSELFGGDAPCFSTFLAETRSSQEVEAQLKDFALGSLDTCVPPELTTDASVDDADFGDEVTDTANLSGSHGPVEGTVDFFICGPTEVTDGGCEGDAGSPAGSDTIVGGVAHSDAVEVGLTSDAVGKYCFRAEYTPSADSEYLATSHTDADRECFEVAPATIDVEKTADEASVLAGSQIGFTVTITNTGNNTALGVELTDALPGGPGIDWSIESQSGGFTIGGSPAAGETLDFGPTSLAAKASATVHIVSNTTADSCGAYDNEASVVTTNDGDDKASDSTFVACPGLSIVKDDAGATYSAVGDVIVYSIVAKNVGNVTLHDVIITDELIDVGSLDCTPALPVADLAPGEEIHCSAEHTVTQADIDAGSYLNTACVDDNMGQGGGAAEVCDDENTPGSQNPELSIVKDDAGATYDEVGDVINYTIVATNIGNVTLKGVVVTDELVDAGSLVCVPATPVDLAPGDSIECTATHTVTQEDLDNGVYLNTACANDTDGPAAEVCDDEDTPGDQNPELAIDKSVAETGFDAVGQVLHYTITVTNVGNITLHGVIVTDEQVSDLECEPDLPVGTLAVGDSFTCTATHTIVLADFDPLLVTNEACADDGLGDGEVGASPVCDDVATPGQELQQETDHPTQPPTDAALGDGNSRPSDSTWFLVIGLALALGSIVVMTPNRRRSKR